MPRAPYTAEDRQRALAALYASGEDVGGEWVPNFTAVSRLKGMPTVRTLSDWWRRRDREKDSTHLHAAQRAREEARKDGAEAYYRDRLSELRDRLSFMLEERHQLTVGAGPEKLGLHHFSRAMKDAGQLLEKVRDLTAPLEAPKEEADTGDPAAAVTALLQRNPELIAAALAALPPAARAAIVARAEEG